MRETRTVLVFFYPYGILTRRLCEALEMGVIRTKNGLADFMRISTKSTSGTHACRRYDKSKHAVVCTCVAHAGELARATNEAYTHALLILFIAVRETSGTRACWR